MPTDCFNEVVLAIFFFFFSVSEQTNHRKQDSIAHKEMGGSLAVSSVTFS